MGKKKMILAGLAAVALLFGMAVTASANNSHLGNDSDANIEMVVTGAYRCPGNFVGGLQHSITFYTTDAGNLTIENQFLNLPYAFQRGGGAGSAFGFVCKGKRNAMLNVIQKLSAEILRPTQ